VRCSHSSEDHDLRVIVHVTVAVGVTAHVMVTALVNRNDILIVIHAV
jgi:hypothetical protein